MSSSLQYPGNKIRYRMSMPGSSMLRETQPQSVNVEPCSWWSFKSWRNIGTRSTNTRESTNTPLRAAWRHSRRTAKILHRTQSICNRLTKSHRARKQVTIHSFLRGPFLDMHGRHSMLRMQGDILYREEMSRIQGDRLYREDMLRIQRVILYTEDMLRTQR